MKSFYFILLFSAGFLFSCKTTKKISKAIAPKVPAISINNAEDSLRLLNQTLDSFKSRKIDFQTFSAKIKVESMDNKGKNPDISANIKIIKDSAIWISLTATIINIEVYRALITKDSVILLNKQDKEVIYRSVNYLQNVTQIPFDFYTLQDLIVGNPIFWSDSITSFKIRNDQVLLSSIGRFFKGIFTLTLDKNKMVHCKLDDLDLYRNRTADITYDGYEQAGKFEFSSTRKLIFSEMNKLELDLEFKQYEFNKDLSVLMKIPKNYKRK